jgi:hypothetical protein
MKNCHLHALLIAAFSTRSLRMSVFSVAGLLCARSSLSLADGLDVWTAQSSGTTNSLTAITYGGGIFVAAGSGQLTAPASSVIVSSSDGQVWTLRYLNTTNSLHSVAFGSNTFVAVGFDPRSQTGFNATSSDGTVWSASSAPLAVFSSVAFGEGLFAGGGRFQMLFSTNGMFWTHQGPVDEWNFTAVGFGNGICVALQGHYTSGIFSSNLVTWYGTAAASATGVAYGNGLFVASDNLGHIRTSTNGAYWLDQVVDAGYNFTSVAFGLNTFVVVGSATNRGEGAIFTSADGFGWRKRTTAASPLLGAAYGNGRFIAVGNNGTILQSGPAFTLQGRQSPSGGFALSLDGETGRFFRVQASPDLSAWTDLLGFTNAQNPTAVVDLTAQQYPRRFYRAVTP